MRRATFEKEVVGTGFDALRTAVQEHSGWLAANCANQVTYYRTFAASRAAAAGVSVPALPPAVSLSGERAGGGGRKGGKTDEVYRSTWEGGARGPQIEVHGEGMRNSEASRPLMQHATKE